MDNMTIGFIYAMKQMPYRTKILYDEAIAYMSDVTATPIEYYNAGIMQRIARNMFEDYIRTCDSPGYEVWNLFNYLEKYDLTNAILYALMSAQVRDQDGNGYKYINGFRDFDKKKLTG